VKDKKKPGKTPEDRYKKKKAAKIEEKGVDKLTKQQKDKLKAKTGYAGKPKDESRKAASPRPVN
jgi:hypothetical protein